MPVTIREARPGEHAEAGRITAEAYREFVGPGEAAWEEYLRHIADVAGRAERTTIVVALDDGLIVGSATLELDDRVDDDDPPLGPDEAHVRMLGVDPTARRRGVARSLMAACEDLARRAGKHRMTLATTSRMSAARRMYESLGFRRVRDRVFPDGFVLLGYEKRLD